MSSPSGPQQPFPHEPQQPPPAAGQPGQFPPPGEGQPGGFPPQGGSPAAGPPPQPVRRAGGWKKRVIGILVGLVVLAGIAGVSWWVNRDAASKAKIGDCVDQVSRNDLKVVECGSSEATFRVVGRVENKTQTEARTSACDPFVDQGAAQAYWRGETGEKGFVLCLAPNT